MCTGSSQRAILSNIISTFRQWDAFVRLVARVVVFVLAGALTLPLIAQEAGVPGSWRPVNPFPEDEAPPYLLDLGIGDTEVELFLLGSWVATSELTLGIALHPPLPDSGERVTWGYPFPDFETRLFAQTVDLTVSLWLYQRYFFEASFADQSDLNSIAAGYYAVEDELVRELVVGNVPLAVSRYPYQYSGNTAARSGATPNPGALVRLGTDRSSHEFLVQLENTTQQRIRISGGRILEEERIAPENYLRGRAFVLPDGQVSEVQVLLQDEDGTITGSRPGESVLRRYRILEAEAGDYVLDTAAGTVRLGSAVPSDRAVAIFYRTAAGPVGAAGNGVGGIAALENTGAAGATQPVPGTVDFAFGSTPLYSFTDTDADYSGDDYRLSLSDGREALLLRAPGLWSPFEAANLFQLPDGAGDDARFRIVRRYTRTPLENEIILQRIPGTALLQAVRAGAAPRSVGYRYPWAEESPRTVHAGIYGPRAVSSRILSESEVLLEYGLSAEEVTLGADLVPGSVAVTSGGQGVSGATVDYQTGTVELPEGAAQNGTVDITYRTYGTDGDSSDLVVINGNRWNPTDAIELTVATGLRWTLTDNGYSTELNQHPGQVTLSAGMEWQGEELKLSAAGAAQVSQSDTTGHIRLFGAAPEESTLTPDAGNLFPAREGARTGSRIHGRYRDYWSSDALGNIALATYPTLPEADTDRSNARIGPYLARSSDPEYTGTVAVLEWDALPDGSWAGARVNQQGAPLDLRDAAALNVTFRYLNDASSIAAPELTFEIGALGEDLDGDGTLDRGNSAVDPLVTFNGAIGQRRAGQDAPALSSPHSEDADGNGVLDSETPGGVFSTPVTATAGWQTVSIPLNATNRGRLSAVRGVRLLATPPTATSLGAGRILIGTVEVIRTRSATLVNAGNDNSGDVSVQRDPLTAPRSLRATEETVSSRFVADEEEQRVLAVEWGDAAGQVEAEFGIPDFSTAAYATLRWYAYLDAPTTGATDELVRMTVAPYRNAAASRTLEMAIPADRLTGRWHEITMNLDTEELRVDGSRIAGAASRGSATDEELLRIASVEVQGLNAGTLYLDELHGADGRATFALAGRIGADWRHTIPDGPFAGVELYATQNIAAQSDGFQAAGSAAAESAISPELATPANGAVATESRGGLQSGAFTLEGEALAIDRGDASSAAFGHLLRLPLWPGGAVTLEERFFRDYRPGSTGFQRESALGAGGRNWGNYRLAAGHSVTITEAEQSWKVDLAPPAAGPVQLSYRGDASLYAPERVISYRSYGDEWSESNTLFLPLSASESAQERSHESAADLGIGLFAFGTTLGWTNRSSLSGEQEQRAGITSSLPLSFTPPFRRPWKITPSYSRSYSFTETVKSDRFGRDASLWGDRLTEEPVILAAPPVVELFRPAGPGRIDSFTAGQLGRAYDAEGRIRYSRATASRLSDLWTPSDVEALVRRSLRWEADTVEDQRLSQLTVTALAINLFGRESAMPLASFYRSDEFRNAVILGLSERPGGESLPEWSVGLEQESAFLGAGENRLELLSTADFSGGEEFAAEFGSELTFIWTRPGYPALAVFERMEESPYYRHEERAAAVLRTLEGEFTGSELSLGHLTRLVITRQGSISAYGDLGWIVDPGEYDDGALHLIGLRLGIEGRLEY